jgi:putative peptide zinc metalloprotease protein
MASGCRAAKFMLNHGQENKGSKMSFSAYSLRPDLRERLELFSKSGEDSFTLQIDESLQVEVTKELAFLLVSLSSSQNMENIAANFKIRFSQEITQDAISCFFQECLDSHLLEPTSEAEPKTARDSEGDDSSGDRPIAMPRPKIYEPAVAVAAKRSPIKQWMVTIFTQQTVYLADKLSRYRKAFGALWYIVSPLAVIALLSAIANWNNIFFVDDTAEAQIGILVIYFMNLLVVQYTSLLVLAAACYSEGGTEIVNSFGFKMKLGFLPRFFLSRAPIYQLPQSKRVRIFGAPMIAKIMMFGVFLFISTNLTLKGSILSYVFLSASHAALIELVLTGVPLTPGDGYGIYVSLTKKSPRLYKTARSIFLRFLRGVPKPPHIDWKNYRNYVGIGFLAILYYVVVGIWITYYFANLALSSLGEIIGGSTFYFTLLVLVGLFLSTLVDPRELIDNFLRSDEHTSNIEARHAKTGKQDETTDQSVVLLPFLAIATLTLFIPVPFSIGGRAVSLSEANSQIIVKEDGFVSEINPQLSSHSKPVSKNTLIFRLTSPTLSDERASAEELVEASRQQLVQQKEALQKLENAPNEDDVKIQIKIVETSRSRFKKQTEELISFRAAKVYADTEVDRYQKLLRDGAASEQDLDQRVVLAENARSSLLAGKQDVQTTKRELETEEAQLTKLLNGSLPEDIAKAKAELNEAKSRLYNEIKKLDAIKRSQERLNIYMPYDGKIVTPRLTESLYKKVKSGDQLAEIYGRNSSILQLRMPEYDAQYLAIGNKAEVRLSAFPGKRFSGLVTSINQAAIGKSYEGNEEYSNSEVGTVFIEVKLTSRGLNKIGILPGMTGFAKVSVGYQPLIVTLTRPIQRFMQLDFWTWFP